MAWTDGADGALKAARASESAEGKFVNFGTKILITCTFPIRCFLRKFTPPSARVSRSRCEENPKMRFYTFFALTLGLSDALALRVAPAATLRAAPVTCMRGGTAAMCAPRRPLDLLAATLPDAAEDVASSEVSAVEDGPAPAKKYCKYDDIRATIAASRARSYAEGRDGCCSKAGGYLGDSKPPANSPWSRSS